MANKVTNSYVKGISQDLNIGMNSNQSITYGLDINIVTNEGESSGIITNHKGNSLSFSIPNTFPVYAIELDGSTGTPFLDINGVGPYVFSITSETTIDNIYDEITASYAAYIAAGEYGVFYNNNQVIIVGFTLDPNVLIGPANNGLVVSTLVPAQEDLSIIGWTTLQDDIILFTTDKNNTNETPNENNLSYYGQVWRVQYDKSTNTIISPNGANLNAQDHLIYNNLLQFSLANEIEREAIGIVENTIKGTVYWTDDYNNPRALNIYNPQSLAIPLSLLDWKPDTQMSTPVVEELMGGGLNEVGAYQIAYQLFSEDGAISNYSPCSKVITLTDSTKNEAYQNYDGAPNGTPSGKSIRFRISNIDTRYDYIKFVCVKYELNNEPVIFSFANLPISTSVMEGVLSGGEVTEQITLSDFVNPLISFDTCKTFTQKKNRLYPANTTSKKFIVDWEARAYRFRSSTDPFGAFTTDLYKQNGLSDSFDASNPASLTSLYALDDSHDAVNPYNDESGSIFGLITPNYATWISDYQCKYQTDGVTFGGEGKNLKYEFQVAKTYGDDELNTSHTFVPFVRVNNTISLNDSLVNPNITELEHNVEGNLSFKNELVTTMYVGYSRGEVYRFGIVFLNDKGEESFVKWIGDIRFPEPWEDSTYDLTETVVNSIKLNNIGIKFTITDTADLPADITGFRIVRMERKEQDKTRLGSGLILGAIKTLIDYDGAGAIAPVSCYSLGYLRTGYPYNADLDSLTVPTNRRLHIYHNGDMFGGNLDPVQPIVDISTVDVALKEEVLGMIKFPDLDFDKYNLGSATHVRVLNEYDADNLRYWDVNTTGTWNSVAEYYKLLNESGPSGAIALNKTSIDSQTVVGIDGVVPSNFHASMGGFDYLNINIYDCEGGDADGLAGAETSSDCLLSGFGTKQLFCAFTSNPLNAAAADERFRIVSLMKHNIGQYGGPWRYARYSNQYIACSDFIPFNLLATSGALDIFVYSGDTFVNYYSTTVSFMHWKEDYGQPNASPSGLGGLYTGYAASMSASAFAYPVESSVNTDMRHGEYWNKSQVFTIANDDTFNKFLSDDYLYNDIYSQQNNIKSYYTEPFSFQEITNQSNYVWVSNRKVSEEEIDNWRIYPINNYLPVELTQGEIVRIVNFKESILAYQNKGICSITSEDRNAIEDATGAVFAVGDGRVIARYDYISKDTGSLHQYSVISTPNCIYHYDSRINKFFQIKPSEGGLLALSDTKGLFNFFKETVKGEIKDSEQILLGFGIHGVYDPKYNKAYFTFLNEVALNYDTLTLPVFPATTYTIDNYSPKYLYKILSIGNIFQVGTSKYKVVYIDKQQIQFTIVSGSIGAIQRKDDINVRFTLAYNENIQAFESFYSFTPTLYICNGERLLSANPYDTNNTVYEHYEGDYGVFYDQDPSTSQVEFILNLPDQSKVPTFRLDNLEIWTECFDEDGIDVPLETLSGLLVYNDYQTSGTSLLNLQAQITIKRQERTWRVNQLYDYTDTTVPVKPFFRNKYNKIRLLYNNQYNRYFKLHETNSNITLSYY